MSVTIATKKVVTTSALTKSLTELESAVKSLNELGDRANQTLRELETYLSTQNIGIPAYVRIGEEEDDGPDIYVGYARFNGKFRLEMHWVESGDSLVEKGWAECSRSEKLKLLDGIPLLLDQLLKEVKKRIEETQASVAHVEAALLPFTPF